MSRVSNTESLTDEAAKRKSRGKDFKVTLYDHGDNKTGSIEQPTDEIIDIPLPINPTSSRNINLSPHIGQGFDSLLPGIYLVFKKAIDDSVKSGQSSSSITTIVSYYMNGFRTFSRYLRVLYSVLKRDVEWSDINNTVIDQYIVYLAQGDQSYATQVSFYSGTKNLLRLCMNAGWLPHIEHPHDLFPKNPYPGSSKSTKGQRPFSKAEFKRLTRAVRDEYKSIVQGSQPLSNFELGICLLALGLRTGINPTPALEIPVDCLQPHPLKSDQMVLVWFKRRGNAVRIQPQRKSEEIAELKSIQFDVVDLIELVRLRNQQLRDYSGEERLFVFKSITTNKGNVAPVSLNGLRNSIKKLVEKHRLKNDDGKPLEVNMSRLRKTFINRVFDLSGGDPLVTARHGGHQLKTANDHYWEAPPEAKVNHRKMIEQRTQFLVSTDLKGGERHTPIAMCADTINGQRAPKNGEHCTEILSCFRCKSFVVTKDDLHRLFSFYWALIEERHSIDTKKWKKQFRYIREVIDENISTQFDSSEVAAIKEEARINRHPAWRDLAMLRNSR